MDNNLKYGNVHLEEIDNVVNTLNLTRDKFEELRKRLRENFTSFIREVLKISSKSHAYV